MYSNNVPTTFSVEESDFFPVSGLSRLNFNVHSIHSFMEEPATSLNELHTVFTERLMKQMIIKFEKDHKFQFHMKKLLSQYVYKLLQLLCDFFSC